MRNKWVRHSKEVLEPIVKNSKSLAEVLEALGLCKAGGNYKNLKKNIQLFELDISHFSGQGWNKGNYKLLGQLKNHKAIKDAMVREFGYKCQICSIASWLDKPLVLELDHINGNSLDNSKDNLRILCPNCHSQTDTFRNRKRKP